MAGKTYRWCVCGRSKKQVSEAYPPLCWYMTCWGHPGSPGSACPRWSSFSHTCLGDNQGVGRGGYSQASAPHGPELPVLCIHPSRCSQRDRNSGPGLRALPPLLVLPPSQGFGSALRGLPVSWSLSPLLPPKKHLGQRFAGLGPQHWTDCTAALPCPRPCPHRVPLPSFGS